MKNIIILIACIGAFNAFCQVPNWTDTSCNTLEYSMYTELANGNAVILDFGAIWCGPCNESAPELQSIWENYGAGTMGVMVFDFLIQDAQGSVADCSDMEEWETQHALTYPGFANSNVNAIYQQYNTLYGSGNIPLILMFIPNENDPSQSTLVYNLTEGLGTTSGDISNDISSILASNGYWALNIDELEATPMEKELVKIVDLMGRETVFKTNTPLIYIYNDGTRERVFQLEK